jgi:Ca-activated chloride channel homolog
VEYARLQVGSDPVIALDRPAVWLTAGVFFALSALAILVYVRRRRRVARAIADPDLLRDLLGTDLQRVPWSRIVPALVAALALAIALLDPAIGSQPPVRRGPVVLLMDASGSMLVEDVGLRRIDLQRELAGELMQELGNVPIGLVAFSGRAFSLTPPTRDAGALRMYLASLDPNIVTQSGSAVGAAIRQGIALLGEGGGTIVLLGDGDETEDREAALQAAQLAARSDVTLHTVAIGTRAGGPVPALDLATGAVQGFLRADQGDLILSRVDEDFLRTLSRRTGGAHFGVDEQNVPQRLSEAITGPAVAPRLQGTAMPPHAWLALTAFLLLVLEPVGPLLRRTS